MLAAYNIRFVDIEEVTNHAAVYFGTQDLADGTVARYRHKFPESRVWLEIDDQKATEITNEYLALVVMNLNEAAFSECGKRHFFQRDALTLPEVTKKKRSVFYNLEWGPDPTTEKTFKTPPSIVRVVHKPFSFNLNPDCTFWLLSSLFKPVYRNTVSRHTYVQRGTQALAPYFTIEFKKARQADEDAEDQVAASAALTLYNRVDLRTRSLKAQGLSPYSTSAFADIKHFGLTFTGDWATLFVCRPMICETAGNEEVGDPWDGCTIGLLRQLRVVIEDDVKELASWVNEIHFWGLTVHADAVEADVKHILLSRRTVNLRVSDIQGAAQSAEHTGDDQD